MKTKAMAAALGLLFLLALTSGGSLSWARTHTDMDRGTTQTDQQDRKSSGFLLVFGQQEDKDQSDRDAGRSQDQGSSYVIFDRDESQSDRDVGKEDTDAGQQQYAMGGRGTDRDVGKERSGTQTDRGTTTERDQGTTGGGQSGTMTPGPGGTTTSPGTTGSPGGGTMGDQGTQSSPGTSGTNQGMGTSR